MIRECNCQVESVTAPVEVGGSRLGGHSPGFRVQGSEFKL